MDIAMAISILMIGAFTIVTLDEKRHNYYDDTRD